MITRKPVPRSLSDKDKDREGSDKASTSLHENRIPWRGGDPRTREGNQEGKERERGRLGLGLGLASSVRVRVRARVRVIRKVGLLTLTLCVCLFTDQLGARKGGSHSEEA